MPQFAFHLYHDLQQFYCERAGGFLLGQAAVHGYPGGSLLLWTQAVRQPSLSKISGMAGCPCAVSSTASWC